MITAKATTVESLLGLLSVSPMSGYKMRQFMAESTSNFWSESFGQIYPALKSMLADGLIEADMPAAGGSPAKKVYRITAAGEARLKAWLGMPVRPPVNRNELLLKVFFGDRVEKKAICRHVEDRKRRAEDDLRRYDRILMQIEAQHAENPAMPYWRMTLRYGILTETAVLRWCDETLAELQEQ